MAKIVDARKLDCPEPVVLTRKALEDSDEVTTIVDNKTARENISRLGKSEGCEVSIEPKKDGTYITLKRAAGVAKTAAPAATGTVLFLGSDLVGRGENIGLGALLMQKFLHTLITSPARPEVILMMNDGVKLVTQDSPSVGELKELEKLGVELFACGTCLARLELTAKVAAGKISNMDEIAGKLLQASKVISL
jgi:selenium metabolism protein YedF